MTEAGWEDVGMMQVIGPEPFGLHITATDAGMVYANALMVALTETGFAATFSRGLPMPPPLLAQLNNRLEKSSEALSEALHETDIVGLLVGHKQ